MLELNKQSTFMNTSDKKNRVHFKSFAFSKPAVKYRKTPMPVRRSARKNIKKKNKTMKKR